MKPHARPVYLNLFRIHLPLSGWVSILHRISGALLFLAFPLGVWALSVSLSSEPGFQRMAAWLTHPLNKLFFVLLIWAFAHHALAGLRHLALDVHWGVERAAAQRSSLGVLLATALITLFAAWRLYA
ncbi:MAG: succinate dehydrogenase, cytochrome b556 subunit [Sulfuriferula multivorans]|uniref:Succinate dehydrogenase cytochrome b556 subunit n=1 Tax=Sulfuriferula multivorans TaxID=1559896 RepID=A0A7C9TAI1_9PROT|nr:succinate dehydrogenase, cytochrome b556 subunit [Sulfuriferula multivorans]